MARHSDDVGNNADSVHRKLLVQENSETHRSHRRVFTRRVFHRQYNYALGHGGEKSCQLCVQDSYTRSKRVGESCYCVGDWIANYGFSIDR